MSDEHAEPASAGEEPNPRDPHSRLNNPAEEPDPTEYPDPYERRPDPRGPDIETAAIPDGEQADSRQRGTPAGPSTSEPHPEDYDSLNPPPHDD